MHEELFSQLLYMARQSDITITEVVGDANDPDVAFCKQRIININRNYKSNISLVPLYVLTLYKEQRRTYY